MRGQGMRWGEEREGEKRERASRIGRERKEKIN